MPTPRANCQAVVSALAVLASVNSATAKDAGELAAAHEAAFERCAYRDAQSIATEWIDALRAEHGREHPSVAAAVADLARDRDWLGDYGSAESGYREALATQRALGEPLAVAETESRLGLFLTDQGHWAEADALLRDALATRRRVLGAETPAVWQSEADLAVLLADRGLEQEAENLLRDALARQRDALGNDAPDAARSALLLAEIVDAEEGEELCRGAFAALRARFGERHVRVADAHAVLGAVLYDIGRPELAEAHFDSSRVVYVDLLGPRHKLVADRLNDLAVMKMTRGHFVEAEAILRESLAIVTTALPDHHPDIAFVMSHLAINLSEQDRYEEARPLYEESLARFRRIDPDHPELGWVLHYYAHDADKRGDLDAAEAGNLAVMERTIRLDGPDNHSVVRDLMRLTGIAWARGDLGTAEERARRATESFERIRHDAGASNSQVQWFKIAPHEMLAEIWVETGRDAEAWAVMDASRARLLDDLRGDQRDPFAQGSGVAAAEAELAEVRAALPERTALVGWMDVSMRPTEARSWAYVIRRNERIRWTRLAAPVGQTLLELQAPNREARGEIAAAARAPVGRPLDGPSGELRRVAQERIAPILPFLDDVDELVVIPSFVMLGFPIELLEDDDGVPLGERFAIMEAPSARAWARRHSRADSAPTRGLFVGDPPFRPEHLASPEASTTLLAVTDATPDVAILRSALGGDRAALASLPRLRWAGREVAGAASALAESRVLLGADATEATLTAMASRGELATYDVLHFATHAIVDGGFLESSALILSQLDRSDDAGADGLVTWTEITRDWKLNAELVVLSACETAEGLDVASEGTVGLATAFLAAGARNVLASRWPVDDEATALFMGRFYASWTGTGGAAPMSCADALRDARKWLREFTDADGRQRFAHPGYWASFVLIAG